MRASAGEIAGAATIAGATIGLAGIGVAAGTAVGSIAALPPGEVAVTGAGSTGTGGGALCPIGTRRNTISTPFLPSVDGSFAADCWRTKSIASRMLASRNSIRGMMIEVSLLVILAVPVASF